MGRAVLDLCTLFPGRFLRRPLVGALILLICSPPALALVPLLPADAEQTAARVEPLGSYALPIGPWDSGSMLTRRTEGRIEQNAYRVPQGADSTLAVLEPMRSALQAEGWRILYECETASCGGFDFRYSTQVLPEPAMHVDLGDFRFLSARRGEGAQERHISLLVSRSSGAGMGYLQLIQIAPAGEQPRPVSVATKDDAPRPATPVPPPATSPVDGDLADLATVLEAQGVVIEGLEFATGAADTATGGDAILTRIASYLKAHPDRSLALVGHTDASGSPDVNMALSKRRAEAVRKRLITEFAIPARQISALGAGFMAPRDSNLTEDGRARNRRVEAILTSTR